MLYECRPPLRLEREKAPHNAYMTSRRAPMIDEMDAWRRITQSPMDRVAHIPTSTDVATYQQVLHGCRRAARMQRRGGARGTAPETPGDAGALDDAGLGPATAVPARRESVYTRCD